MKCLSLWQPYATLLAAGLKRCETRGWPTDHRGPLLIHAAKHWDRELAEIVRHSPFRESLFNLGVVPVASSHRPAGLPFGAIIGRVDVVGCYATGEVVDGDRVEADPNRKGRLVIDRDEDAFGDFTYGRFAFLCANPVRFDAPIPYRGSQMLFDVPDELIGGAA